MAAEINWVDHLSSAESETYAELVNNGIEVYAVPVVIDSDSQLDTLGVSRGDCFIQRIGPRPVLVHFTPGSKELYDLMYGTERNEYRREARNARCMVPGERGLPIRCPECNKCKDCPFTKISEQHQTNTLSWEQLIDDGCEPVSENDLSAQVSDRDEITRIMERLHKANPEYVEMVKMAVDGYSRKEIAEHFKVSLVTVYKRFERIKQIAEKAI